MPKLMLVTVTQRPELMETEYLYDAYEDADDYGLDERHGYRWRKHNDPPELVSRCAKCNWTFDDRSFEVQRFADGPNTWYHVRCFDFDAARSTYAPMDGWYAKPWPKNPPGIYSKAWVKELVKAMQHPSFNFTASESLLLQLAE